MIAAALAAVLVAAVGALWYFTWCGDCGETDRFAPDNAAGDTEVSVVVPDTPGVDAAPAPAVVAEPVAPAEPAPTVSAPVMAPPPGQLSIRSNPAGALVTIDEEFEGTTPVVVTGLALGAHVVQVAHPGFVPVRETVELTAGAPSRTLALDLSSGVPDVAPRFGALDVDSRPRGAVVTVDGRRAGVTPLQLTSLDAGTRVVRLELGGYRTVRAEVTIKPGERSRLAVTLEPGDARAVR